MRDGDLATGGEGMTRRDGDGIVWLALVGLVVSFLGAVILLYAGR